MATAKSKGNPAAERIAVDLANGYSLRECLYREMALDIVPAAVQIMPQQERIASWRAAMERAIAALDDVQHGRI